VLNCFAHCQYDRLVVTAMSGHLQILSTNPVYGVITETGSSFEVPTNSRLLNRLLTDNRTSPEHFPSHTVAPLSPAILDSPSLPSAILDSPSVAERNLLPVVGPEVVKDDEFTSGGSTEPTLPCSGQDENHSKNDDVIRTRVAKSNDVCFCLRSLNLLVHALH